MGGGGGYEHTHKNETKIKKDHKVIIGYLSEINNRIRIYYVRGEYDPQPFK